jgi:hypothetical protein
MARYDSTGQSTGKESSSTYEGRHLSLLGSKLKSKGTVATTGLVKGEPVTFGDEGVGVAFNSVAQALLATTYVAIDTEGIWWLSVVTSGTMVPGDIVYIHLTTAVLSDSAKGGVRFGYVVADVANGSGQAVLAPVKVHKG